MIRQVLLLDDDVTRNMVFEKEYLRHHQLNEISKVDVLSDPGKALSIIESIRVDLLVIDLHMGPVDGFDVIQVVKKVSPKTIIWMYTGMSEDYISDKRKGLVDRFIHKDRREKYLLDEILKIRFGEIEIEAEG